MVQKIIPDPTMNTVDGEDMVIEPRPGRTGGEIRQLFQDEGVAPPNELTPTYLTARVPARLMSKLSRIAVVQAKPRKQMNRF